MIIVIFIDIMFVNPQGNKFLQWILTSLSQKTYQILQINQISHRSISLLLTKYNHDKQWTWRQRTWRNQTSEYASNKSAQAINTIDWLIEWLFFYTTTVWVFSAVYYLNGQLEPYLPFSFSFRRLTWLLRCKTWTRKFPIMKLNT